MVPGLVHNQALYRILRIRPRHHPRLVVQELLIRHRRAQDQQVFLLPALVPRRVLNLLSLLRHDHKPLVAAVENLFHLDHSEVRHPQGLVLPALAQARARDLVSHQFQIQDLLLQCQMAVVLAMYQALPPMLAQIRPPVLVSRQRRRQLLMQEAQDLLLLYQMVAVPRMFLVPPPMLDQAVVVSGSLFPAVVASTSNIPLHLV